MVLLLFQAGVKLAVKLAVKLGLRLPPTHLDDSDDVVCARHPVRDEHSPEDKLCELDHSVVDAQRVLQPAEDAPPPVAPQAQKPGSSFESTVSLFTIKI